MLKWIHVSKKTTGERKITKNHHNKQYVKEIISEYAVTSVPADGLAPLGARASVDRAMIKFGPSTGSEK